MASVPTGTLTIEQWVSDSIITVKDTAKRIPDPTEYDERIQNDFDDFIKDDNFFSMPLSVVFRNIDKNGKIFTSEEANRAILLSRKFHGPKGLSIMTHIKTKDLTPEESLSVFKGLDDTPLFSSLFTNRFKAPTKEKTDLEIELEALAEKRQAVLVEVTKKAQQTQARIDELEDQKRRLEKYQVEARAWPEESAQIIERINFLLKDNQRLSKENASWKNAAFRTNIEKPENFCEKIHTACRDNNIESVLYLVETDPKTVDKVKRINGDEMTPLMVAATYGRLEIAKILVTHGANVNKKYWHGSPLSLARDHKHNDIAEYLIENGAVDK